ncbi:MAG TPA: winged helix-turn-helix domain-containing protein [Steroidobacteraceae bacterium]|nr:winged helix-turn-helix domain-containing protein [Steroidobacteraceae bacterium]
MTKPPVIHFDDWTLHRASGELERAGSRVRLQELPFQILDELLSRAGEVVTREELIARLWPKTVVDFDTNLNSGVRRLRAVLHDDADAPRYIETLPRRGYRYIGDAPRADVATLPAPVSSPASGPRRGQILAWVGVCAALVASGALAIYLSDTAGAPVETISPNAKESRLRLAVLPFKNLSPDPANAFFTDGMHEEILGAIANRAVNLEVISRTTMRVYRDAPKSVREIAKELHVTHVLEGSVRREGQTVRLTLQLIDARSDTHLWSKNFDRQLVDTIALQSAVAEEVGSQLAVKLSGNIGELPQSANPDAYDLYLKSQLSMLTIHAARSPRVQLEALGLLDRAIGLDGTFAAAYLARARIRMARFIGSLDVSEANLAVLRADLAVARGVMGDTPPLLVTEAAYAQLVDFDRAKAGRLLETAERMNPHSSEVSLYLARFLSFAGRHDEAFAYHRRAAQLDPGNNLVTSDWATGLKLARRGEESLRVARDFDSLYPGLITYGWRLFAFTGHLQRFEYEIARRDALSNPEAQLAARFNLFLYSRRFPELKALVEQSDLDTIPQSLAGMLTVPAIGRKPLAELHGWVQLLEQDVAAAARDGRVLLEFAAHEPVTKWNAWYLRMLAAEGALLTGDKVKAVVEARAALVMAPRNIHPGIELYAQAQAARVLAWADAGGEAVTLLEQLSTQYPMFGPAEITRDPLYALPLAGNARYKVLERKLEAEIADNQRWRDP